MSSASLQGGAGDDTIQFTSGSVSILATTIKGGAGADKVGLYGANDVVFDLVSGDDIIGGTGADTLLFTNTVSNSVIQAGSGNDSLVLSGTGMTGNTIDLGVGTDTIKFTKATNADTVTVTSTTISGAKSITYEKAATAVAITTAAGADVVVFEAAVSGAGTIATNSEMTPFGSQSRLPLLVGAYILVQVLTLSMVQKSSATAPSVVLQAGIPS